MGRLFPEEDIILILTMPKSGTQIQYNKRNDVISTNNIFIEQLMDETFQGIFPIYVYSVPFSEPFPVEVIKAGEEP